MLFSAPSRKFAPVLPYVARKTAWEEKRDRQERAKQVQLRLRREEDLSVA